ncbi:tRNA glutamyl-Q(34) synthetase GluQRS [Halocynthiibacter namhaensis]|uniref:tRNA glutamyl-Q(34) synthetase GluQRS n=1 Tax=Halocynthiibacter namhaensis TaxID=1290553 RepID=UPI0005793DE6|nr:tRNA glutamyl-Q(34) synthetase GluQRS [Halocynthiibacter namhaensis]
MRTRFAPSPTGPLHLGHAYSALLAFDHARKHSGEFLLRMEDIDQSRARPHWEAQIYDDLQWLGISWVTPVMRQSDHLPRYQDAIRKLHKLGLVYPCSCNRRDIEAALCAPQEGVNRFGPDGLIYPGTCKSFHTPMPDKAVLRLNLAAAFDHLANDLTFQEFGTDMDTQPQHINVSRELIETAGDIIISRKDMGTSYHLSVVLDDALQGITDVTRGEDLLEATALHVVLQNLLGLPRPRYHHHRLIRDEDGKRLAKRDDARAISQYRDAGATAADIRKMVGL